MAFINECLKTRSKHENNNEREEEIEKRQEEKFKQISFDRRKSFSK
jgi:hypothetical protein